MYIIIWKFEINPELENKFLQAYGTEGFWTQFFRQDKNYLGTELLKNTDDPSYITIDRWQSAEAYENFIKTQRTAYEKLDKDYANLTLREFKIGTFLLTQ